MANQGARIQTTHTGSLPLLAEQKPLQELLTARALGKKFDLREFQERADEAVDEVVGRQREIGIDIVSNGQADRSGFLDTSRLTGFDGRPTRTFTAHDLKEAGMLDWFLNHSGAVLPRANTGPVRHNPEPIAAELGRFRSALDHHGIDRARAFLAEPSPGVVAAQGSTHYDDESKLLADLTSALRAEYCAIAETGITLQVDAPDLFMDWFVWHQGQNWGAYADRMKLSIEAINRATEGIPDERLRVHVCHGNWQGPHHMDVELPAVIDILYSNLRSCTLVLELANPRHSWERKIFSQHPLPAGKTLAAGVVDSCTTSVEHENTVANRVIEVATAAGRGRVVMATPDCGFATMLGLHAQPYTADLKLRALVKGTRIANERLRELDGLP